MAVPGSQGVLEISYIGYVTREVAVSKATTALDIVLEEDAQTMDDVVVLGFGAAARKADLSTSVGVLSNVEQNKSRRSARWRVFSRARSRALRSSIMAATRPPHPP